MPHGSGSFHCPAPVECDGHPAARGRGSSRPSLSSFLSQGVLYKAWRRPNSHSWHLDISPVIFGIHVPGQTKFPSPVCLLSSCPVFSHGSPPLCSLQILLSLQTRLFATPGYLQKASCRAVDIKPVDMDPELSWDKAGRQNCQEA